MAEAASLDTPVHASQALCHSWDVAGRLYCLQRVAGWQVRVPVPARKLVCALHAQTAWRTGISAIT